MSADVIVGGATPPYDIDKPRAPSALVSLLPGTMIAQADERLLHELSRVLGCGSRKAAE